MNADTTSEETTASGIGAAWVQARRNSTVTVVKSASHSNSTTQQTCLQERIAAARRLREEAASAVKGRTEQVREQEAQCASTATAYSSGEHHQRPKQVVTFSAAGDGGEIAILQDQDGRTIIVDAADYRRLIALGFTGRWFTNEVTKGYRYVRVSRAPRETGGQALFTVSRLILGAGERQSVRHRDGNRLNLRRRNLVLRSGKGGAGAQAVLQEARDGGADVR